ncbi:MAG: hypothetical protein Q8O99_01505 [bacterium]|nr:hypothetical protein [bacterium]
MNLDQEAFAANPKYPITKDETTDRELARNPSVDRQVGRPWYDPAGARLVITEVTEDQQHATAHHDF